MSNFYDDAKFGIIQRKWFGLTKKWGGDVAGGFTYGTAHGTSISHVAKFYPRGPIKITKAGSFVLATLANASSDLHIARIRTRGASASIAVQWYMKSTSTQVLQAVIASNTPQNGLPTGNPPTTTSGNTTVINQCKAGEYLQVMTATPTTDKATRVQATTTGSTAFFVDYVPTFMDLSKGGLGKWDS